MFTRIKLASSYKRLYKAWGSNPKHPTINETIIAGPAMFISSIKDRSYIFSNKYVCSDAILIMCAYATKILRDTGAPLEIIQDLKGKALTAIESEYGVSGLELLNMQKNRFDFFGKLLDLNESDISPVIEEAGLVFAFDLHYNKFVEYSSFSPLVVMSHNKQTQIESETLAYFKTSLGLVTDALKQYYK